MGSAWDGGGGGGGASKHVSPLFAGENFIVSNNACRLSLKNGLACSATSSNLVLNAVFTGVCKNPSFEAFEFKFNDGGDIHWGGRLRKIPSSFCVK